MNDAPGPSGLRTAGALATVYVIWGSTYLAIRFAIETLPPFLMAGVRFVVAGALLYSWLRLRGAARPRPVHWRGAAVVGALMLLGGNGAVVWAEQFVASGTTALLVATVPLWLVLIDSLTGGHRPRPLVWVGILIGFVGVSLLIRPGGAPGGVDPLGAAVLVLASISWAYGSLRSRRIALPSSPLLGVALQMLAGGALLLLVGLAAGEAADVSLGAVSMRSLLSLCYLILFGSLAGYTSYVWLMRHATTALVGTYAYVNPVVAVFLGWALAGEVVTARTLLGAAVILAGVALITTARFRPAPRA